jgi:hypothetical protein
MDATLWAGNNASPRSITNDAAFKPDLVWIKNRSGTQWHNLVDSVRGVNRDLFSNSTNAEALNDTTGTVSAFNTGGFSVSAGSSDSSDVNATGSNYVGWQWQAGQGSSSSNTDGSITSTVSVNPTAGFSVVTYTGYWIKCNCWAWSRCCPNQWLFLRYATKSMDGAGIPQVNWQYLRFAFKYTMRTTRPVCEHSTSPTSSVFSHWHMEC